MNPVTHDIAGTQGIRSPVHEEAVLRFARAGGNTILERAFAANPLKVMTTRGVGPACWVYAATYGGGIVGGDAIRLNVDVGRGARAVLSTQASTKVYRALRPASQHVSATVDDEALLAVVPDPVVCFAGANFSQEQTYRLHERGNLVMIDWVTSGRHATGERWAFRHYSSRIDIRRADQRIVYDALLLDEGDGAIGERLGGFNVCLTAVVTGPLLSDAAAAIVHASSTTGSVGPLGNDTRADFIETAWMLPDGGALLRMSGISVEQVGTALRARLAFLCDLLGDDPWGRKW
jgi:urease accessory protein